MDSAGNDTLSHCCFPFLPSLSSSPCFMSSPCLSTSFHVSATQIFILINLWSLGFSPSRQYRCFIHIFLISSPVDTFHSHWPHLLFPFSLHVICCAHIFFYIFLVLMNPWSWGSSHIKYHVSFIHSVMSSSFFLQGSWNNTSVILLPIFIVSLLSSCTSFSLLCLFCQGLHGAMYTLFFNIILFCLFLTAGAQIPCYFILLILLVQREIVHVSCSIMWHRHLRNVGCLFDSNLSCGDGV